MMSTAIMTVLKARHTLAAFGSRLPGHIKSFDDSNDPATSRR